MILAIQAPWFPLFFVQGQGGTPLRQVVLGTSVILFGGTAWLMRSSPGSPSTFVRWYGLALALLATGLLALLFQSAAGGLLNWTGRAAQVLSGVYMLVAAIASARETGAWHLSLEQQLKEVVEEYGTLFELSPDGVLIHAMADEPATGKIVQANRAICRLLGYSAAELHQLSPRELTAPEERPLLLHLREALLEKGVLRHERQLLARDGRVIPCELNSQLFERHGRPMVVSFVRDMSEHRAAEAKVREHEAKLRTAFSGAAIGFALTTPDGRYLEVNRAYCRLTGYEESELLGREFPQLLHPDDYAENIALNREMEENKRDRFVIENRYIRKDGRVVWVRKSIGIVRNETGSPLWNIALVEDITERKQAEAELRERERLLAISQQVAHVGNWCWQVDQDHITWSDEVYRIFGVRRETFSPDLGNLRALVHPEDRPKQERAVRQLLAGHSIDPFEYRISRPDGEQRIVRVLEAKVDWHKDGKPWRIYGVVADITEQRRQEQALRESEERFRVAQELSPDGFTILRPVKDPAGRIIDFTWIYSNAAAGRLTGKLPEQMIGKRFLQLFPNHHATVFLENYQAAAETRQQRVFEAQYSGDAVVPAWFRVAVVPVGDDIAVLAQDITRQKEFQAELQRLVDERTAKLKELVGELEHFSYTITHDMRAPLRGMQGFAEMMADACAGCERQDPKGFLRRIKTSGQRMDALITDALQYAKTVRQELAITPVDVGALLRGMLDSYPEFQTEKAHIRIQGELPLVMGNEAGLTQVLSNLLGNAVKFVNPGQKPEILIRAELCPAVAAEKQHRVRLWVEDNGIGISEPMKPKVFDMFSRGHRSYEGTGIGLALVRKVMERMGGKVGVDSEEGKGSRFWVELGLVEAFSRTATDHGNAAAKSN